MLKQRGNGWLRLAVIIISLGLYAVACTRPAAEVSLFRRPGVMIGFGLLMYGWTGGVQVAIPWLSNFVWLAGLVLLARSRLRGAWACSTVGLLFASRVLFPFEELGTPLLEAKWWWLSSHVTLVVGSGLAWFADRVAIPVTVDPYFSEPIGSKPGK